MCTKRKKNVFIAPETHTPNLWQFSKDEQNKYNSGQFSYEEFTVNIEKRMNLKGRRYISNDELFWFFGLNMMASFFSIASEIFVIWFKTKAEFFSQHSMGCFSHLFLRYHIRLWTFRTISAFRRSKDVVSTYTFFGDTLLLLLFLFELMLNRSSSKVSDAFECFLFLHVGTGSLVYASDGFHHLIESPFIYNMCAQFSYWNDSLHWLMRCWF